MNRFLALTTVVLVCLFATSLAAQGQGRSIRKSRNEMKKSADEANKEYQKKAQKAAKNAEKEEKAEERDEAKAEREAKRNGEEEDGIGIVGGGDDATPDNLPEPGATIDRAVKDKTIDEIMDELGLKDESKRAAFKRNVRDAWEDTEKEDKTYGGKYKRYEDDNEKLADAKKDHVEKLKKIWDESDEKLKKDEVLDEDQTTRWKKTSAELRTKTNTDRYYEAKAKQAAAEEANKEADKKEKKDEEEDK